MTASHASYFALFSLDVAVLIDETQLENAYQTLQKTYHPNRAARTPQAQMVAAKQSSYIQDAYNSLLNPADRLFHILAIYASDTKPSALDGEFLIDMMMLREQLASQNTGSEAHNALEKRIAETLKKAHKVFMCADTDSDEQSNWQVFADLAEQMRFLINMKKQISASSDL